MTKERHFGTTKNCKDVCPVEWHSKGQKSLQHFVHILGETMLNPFWNLLTFSSRLWQSWHFDEKLSHKELKLFNNCWHHLFYRNVRHYFYFVWEQFIWMINTQKLSGIVSAIYNFLPLKWTKSFKSGGHCLWHSLSYNLPFKRIGKLFLDFVYWGLAFRKELITFTRQLECFTERFLPS